MRKRNQGRKTVVFFASLILALAVVIGGLWILESTVFAPGGAQEAYERKTITKNGVDYFLRQDITVMLVMGTGRTDPAQDSGQSTAELVMLLIFDDKDKAYSILYLDRDTILSMPVLDADGRKAGTVSGQLALAHSYGSGREDSCENTEKAVSDFLNGIPVDCYLCVDQDGFSVLNDAVGGVQVVVEEDFSGTDPSIPQGEVTLRGEQAVHFLLAGENELYLSRIQRQQAYMEGFLEALRDALEEDPGFAMTVYDKVKPYVVTDCSLSTVSGLVSRCKGYGLRETVTLEGEYVLSSGGWEFHADEEQLEALVLRLFYAPKGAA